ncbi:MAG: sigma-70 family RNA polymerase sigma factor [Anaerolineaceae bacterium]|nr:sigma-70 family RNA polymerase sigma factor [Anaerolineaceae bacterium]
MTDSEQEWLDLARNGDDEAFSRLVETYQAPVYNLCYRMLGESTAAEDAAQETFWRAYQNLKKYDPARPFITWLLSIAAHFCIDQQRKRKLPVFELDEFPDLDLEDHSIPNPEKEFSHNQENDALHQLINQLNPQDRATVILKYWYDCSEEEISQMLSLTVSAVKSRLHRSRRQLAEMLSQNPMLVVNERRTHESPVL